jgi:hypothetical protein
MTTPDPYDALRALSPEAGAWLGPDDGDALRDLLAARYGQTYGDAACHEPGELEARWASRRLLSLGRWRGGRLDGHTGFRFDPRDPTCVTSCLTVTRPGSLIPSPDLLATLWPPILAALERAGARALTQNTSTLHPVAQQLALTHMRALPSGLRVRYTLGERVAGLDAAPDVMHALTMTTPLGPPPDRTVFVPDDAWGRWLASIALPFSLRVAAAPERRADHTFGHRVTRDDPRFGARVAEVAPSSTDLPAPEGARRVELRHVDASDAALVSGAHGALLRGGFVPVGWRLGAAPRLVYQLLPDRGEAAAQTAGAALATPAIRDLWNQWRSLCARTP